MRVAILTFVGVLIVALAAWKLVLYFNPDTESTSTPTQAATQVDPKSNQVPFPVVKVAERFAIAIARVNIAALEAEPRPPMAIRVTSITKGSQADRKGVKFGDMFFKLNGEPIQGEQAYGQRTLEHDTNSITAWSQTSGISEYSFTGQMGIEYMEDPYWEMTYIRSKERNPAWDQAVIVAIESMESDQELALYALNEARKGGYNGWFLPAVTTVANCALARFDEAKKDLPKLKTNLPECGARIFLESIYRYLVSGGQLQTAADLDKQFPMYVLCPQERYMDELNAQFSALSESERALIGADGKLKREVVNDYSNGLQGLNANGKMAVEYWSTHPAKALVAQASGSRLIYAFGPFASNAGVKMSFQFDPAISQPAGEAYYRIGIVDNLGAFDLPNAAITCYVNGNSDLGTERYPNIPLPTRALMNIEGENQVEVYTNGPWFEIWLNGHRLFQGLTAHPERELYVQFYACNVNGRFKKPEYAELNSHGWKASNPVTVSGPTKAVSIPKSSEKGDLPWFYDVFVTSYFEHGKRNPAWDADALEALEPASRCLGRDATADPMVIYEATQRAIAHGCDDPLVMKIHADMISTVRRHHAPDAQRWYKAAADAMAGSQYHPLLKICTLRQASSYEHYSELDPLIERAEKRIAKITELIPAAFKDRKAPKWFVNQVLVEELSEMPQFGGVANKSRLDPIFASMDKITEAASVALTLKGAMYINYAWEARGYGWARSVNPEAAKLMQERLQIANNALTRAWELDSKNSTAMQHMITVSMGGGSDLDVSTCFKNAMNADPANIAACEAFINAIMPRWGGSNEALHAFGMGCFTAVKKDPKCSPYVARELITVHRELMEEESVGTEDPLERERIQERYWARPEVWSDVSDAFELILERAPTSVMKTEYIVWAMRCKKWDVAKKLVDELGSRLIAAEFGGPGWVPSAKLQISKEAKWQHIRETNPDLK